MRFNGGRNSRAGSPQRVIQLHFQTAVSPFMLIRCLKQLTLRTEYLCQPLWMCNFKTSHCVPSVRSSFTKHLSPSVQISMPVTADTVHEALPPSSSAHKTCSGCDIEMLLWVTVTLSSVYINMSLYVLVRNSWRHTVCHSHMYTFEPVSKCRRFLNACSVLVRYAGHNLSLCAVGGESGALCNC